MDAIVKDHDGLRSLAGRVIAAGGSGPEEAAIVADHLVESNLTGHDSHGIGLIPMYVRDRLAGGNQPNRHATLVSDAGAIGVFDGGMGYGQVMAGEATAWGVARARELGVGLVTLRNSYHIGRVGAYGEQAASEGVVAILFANVMAGGTQKVAPFGGADGRLQTNPVCIAVPAAEGRPPFLLDFATSRIAVNKVRVALNEHRAVAPGILIDADGQPTQDPAVMFREPSGSVLPFGEHKGSGLAVACELLAGALSGGLSNRTKVPADRCTTNNMLGIFIDPGRLGDLPMFRDDVGAVLDHVRGSPPLDPQRPVMVAGEPEQRSRARRLAGGIPIDATTWREILDAARAIGASVEA